jgi:hypothetical protein
MKILIITIGIISGIFVVYQVYSEMATRKTETQSYKIILVGKLFEIRYYPAATMAKISSNVTSYRELGNSGFSILANYIFGGNAEKKQIAMTSPVHMDIGKSTSTMAFVMPANFNQDDLPTPNNSDILFHTSAPEYVAVIQFGGFASNEKINEQKALLEKVLQEKGLPYFGNFRFLGYNPPYQLIGRRNEIIVALDTDQIEKTDFN